MQIPYPAFDLRKPVVEALVLDICDERGTHMRRAVLPIFVSLDAATRSNLGGYVFTFVAPRSWGCRKSLALNRQDSLEVNVTSALHNERFSRCGGNHIDLARRHGLVGFFHTEL
jgi:hypothetical protein